MNLKKGTVLFLLFLFFPLAGISMADDADVLPKGVSKASLTTSIWSPINKRFDPDGSRENVDADFNANLNSTVFPALGDLELVLGLPPGFATLGQTIVDFEYKFEEVELQLAYGLTKKLTIGVYVPFWWSKTQVNQAQLDTSNATIGKNAALDSLAPLPQYGGPPGTVPLTTADIQSLLGPGLDINGDGTVTIPGYGYDPVATWSDQGIGDIEVGARYQYYKSDIWRLAFTGGVRMPTGKEDDPDNLIDYPPGAGAWAILFRLQNDFIGIENLTLNATFRYDWYLPDKQTLRILNDPNVPLTYIKENVDRDLGDIYDLEFSGKYKLPKGFGVSALYQYRAKGKDGIKGSLPLDYTPLELETNFTSHIYILGLSYSTVPLYLEKKFSVPLDCSLNYRNRFAGSNNALDSEYVSLEVDLYF